MSLKSLRDYFKVWIKQTRNQLESMSDKVYNKIKRKKCKKKNSVKDAGD